MKLVDMQQTVSLTELLAPSAESPDTTGNPTDIETNVRRAMQNVLTLKERYVLEALYLRTQQDTTVSKEELIKNIEARGLPLVGNTEAEALRALSYGGSRKKQREVPLPSAKDSDLWKN